MTGPQRHNSGARVILAGIFVLAGISLAAVTNARAETVTLQGSTTFNAAIMEPLRSQIEEAAGRKLTVIASKSTGGIVSLFEGRGDIAMISAPLAGEIAVLRKTDPNLRFDLLRTFPVSRTRMAFAINSEISIRSLPAETMGRVLLGEITNWKDLGGPDLPIRLVMVRDGGGVKLAVESKLLGGKAVSVKDPIYVQIGSQVVRVVQQLPGTLGLAQLGHLRRQNLPEILLSDTEIIQELSLVTLGEPTTALKAVIEAIQEIARRELD